MVCVRFTTRPQPDDYLADSNPDMVCKLRVVALAGRDMRGIVSW